LNDGLRKIYRESVEARITCQYAYTILGGEMKVLGGFSYHDKGGDEITDRRNDWWETIMQRKAGRSC